MANNKAVESIIKNYISTLPVDKVAELVNSAIADKNISFTLKTPSRYWGDIRIVNLPNIDAASEFDELMESFKGVHGLTIISEPDDN